MFLVFLLVRGHLLIKMDDSIHSSVIKRRASLLRRLGEERRQEFYKQFIGQELSVLCEQYTDEINSGYTENYIRVSFESKKDFSREIKIIKLTKNYW